MVADAAWIDVTGIIVAGIIEEEVFFINRFTRIYEWDISYISRLKYLGNRNRKESLQV